jgi:very-short-patch-repair endonuclease
MTGPEKRLWGKLRAKQFLGLKFRRQHGIGPYIVGFYCPQRSIVIELDGESHSQGAAIQRDQRRDGYLQSLNLVVVRYTNDDVLRNLDGVLEDLAKRINS